MASHRTCIICDKPAGSGEHIFPASLGGRRTNRGIYCGEHDNGFSPLVSALAYQLRMLNGQLEVVNDHRRREGFVAPEVEDADGVVHAIAGGAFIPQRSRVLARETDAQGREILQLAVAERLIEALYKLRDNRADIVPLDMLGLTEDKDFRWMSGQWKRLVLVRPSGKGRAVRADSNLSHPADRILSRGWKPTFRWSAVHKCRWLPGSSASLSMSLTVRGKTRRA